MNIVRQAMVSGISVLILAVGLKVAAFSMRKDKDANFEFSYSYKEISDTIKDIESRKKDFAWIMGYFWFIFFAVSKAWSLVFPPAGPENNFGQKLPKVALE